MATTSKVAQYNGGITPFVVLSCTIAAMGGLLFGYEFGISGAVTSMEPFLIKFFPGIYIKMKDDVTISNYCKFNSQLLFAFVSSLYLAGLVASFFASSVTRHFGRKPSILAGGVAYFFGSALTGASLNVYMLIIGRVLLGVGVGFTNQSVPLYLSEIAPTRYRGAICNGFQLFIGIGVLAASFINYGTEMIEGGWGWRISSAMAAVPAAILALGTIFLPDTPNSIIQRSNNHQKAKATLQQIRGTTDVDSELEHLIQASSISKTIKHLFKIIIKRKYLPQVVMAIAIPFFQVATGVYVIAFHAPMLLRTIGLSQSMSLIMSAVIAGAVGSIATFISMLAVDKLGRRALFVIGGVQMFVSQVTIGGTVKAQLGDHGNLDKGYAYFVLIMVCIYVAGFAWSWGPLGWLIPSEIFPLEIRSAGQSIAVAVNFLFLFILGQTFLAMLCYFKSGIFFFFAGWIAVMTTFVYFLLPETKNVPIELMNRVWREHWFWKGIVGEAEEKTQVPPTQH